MISIIVPVYNVESYLKDCLESLSKQTLRNIEVIIVNDGSKDNSKSICLEYVCDRRFSYYEKDNGGLMSAYLYGIQKSKGEYIGFVDSDDWVEPTMFEKLLNVAINTNSDIVMCDCNLYTKNGMIQQSKTNIKTSVEVIDESRIEHDLYQKIFPSLRGGNISSARWNKLFKREIILQNVNYCEKQSRYFEDRYLVPACLFSCRKFAYIHEKLYNYRLRKSANSKSANDKLLFTIEDIYVTQERMLKDKQIFEKFKKNLDVAFINYMKVVIERNVILTKGLAGFSTCKNILTKKNRTIVITNKDECVNKFGKCLYFSSKLKMPIILFLFSKIFKKNYKNNKWYFD